MDKGILNYIRGDSSVILTDNGLMVTKEPNSNGWEYITVKIVEKDREDIILYTFWHNQNESTNKKPKHTGGKKPYLMVMVNEIEELRNKGVKNVEELIGYVTCLGKYIEWNTGKLMQNKRNKKPIQYKDLLDIYKCSKPKLNKMIKLMKDNDLLYHTDEGYFISQKYIKKGKSQNKKEVIEND